MVRVPHPEPRLGYYVRQRGRVIEAHKVLVHRQGVTQGAVVTRGSVTTWTKRSRNRMCRAVASVPWSGERRRLFLTLTFAEAGKVDGRKELYALRRRWERRFGKMQCIWWREFQARGVVHFHLLAQVTEPQAVMIKRWVPGAWRACGGGFVANREWHGPTKRLYAYAMKEAFAAGKSYQHELPVGHDEGLGRWWGVWGCRGGWEVRRLGFPEYCELRRRARRWGLRYASLRARGVLSWWAVAPPELLRGLCE